MILERQRKDQKWWPALRILADQTTCRPKLVIVNILRWFVYSSNTHQVLGLLYQEELTSTSDERRSNVIFISFSVSSGHFLWNHYDM